MAFMNGRVVVLGSALLGLSSLVGCGNAPVTCDAGQVLNAAGVCVAEVVPTPTPTAPVYFSPVYFVAEGIFGYNPDWDTTFPVKAVDQSGQEFVINPLITVTLAEETYLTQGDDTKKCVVQFAPAGDPTGAAGNLAPATWVGDAGVDFGFQVPADEQPMDNCGDMNFDAAIWGDNIGANVASFDWGLGVSLAIDSEVQTKMAEQYAGSTDINYDTEIKPFMLGGGFYNSALVGQDGFPGGFANKGYTFAIELDSNDTLVAENGRDKWIPLENMTVDGTSITDGGTAALVRAAYQINAFYFMGGADQLFIKQ